MGKSLLIIAADDEELILKLLGVSSLEEIVERNSDLVILDVIISDPDDLQVLDLVPQDSNVPIIILVVGCEDNALHDTIVLDSIGEVSVDSVIPDISNLGIETNGN